MSNAIATNKKRKYIDSHQQQGPSRKKQKLNTKISRSTTLLDQCPNNIKELITEFTAINFENVSIVSTENEYSRAPIGDIRFDIMDIDLPSKLASFKAKWDSGYKRIDFEDVDEFDEYFESDSNSEGKLFKAYSHLMDLDLNLNEFIEKSFFKVKKYIFDYKDNRFSTIVFPSDFIKRHQIKFRQNYHPYIVGNKHYFLRISEPNPLFNNNKIKSYECSVLIKDDRAIRYISNINDCKPALEKAMKLEQKLWNNIDGILNIIMEYIPDQNEDHTMEFQRQCLIVKNSDIDNQATIYFDSPIIFIAHHPSDIPFKLRINDIDITAPQFCFDNNYSDRKFRVNKYGCSNNIDWFHIDQNHCVLVYYYLQTRYRSARNQYIYGYNTFEERIDSSELEIVDTMDHNLDNWDDEMIKALEKLEELTK